MAMHIRETRAQIQELCRQASLPPAEFSRLPPRIEYPEISDDEDEDEDADGDEEEEDEETKDEDVSE